MYLYADMYFDGGRKVGGMDRCTDARADGQKMDGWMDREVGRLVVGWVMGGLLSR